MLAAVLPVACERGFGDAAEPQLVVEGWIDSGRFPVVVLSRTVPITDDYQPTGQLADCVERWARVAVSDGEREVSYTPAYDIASMTLYSVLEFLGAISFDSMYSHHFSP